MIIHAQRLLPHQDLKVSIEKYVGQHHIAAGVILSAVGSLVRATLRLADGKTIKSYDQMFEIVSMTGTVSVNGCHLHLSLSDENGQLVGGHLKEGCIIKTTAEIIIGEIEKMGFYREFDDKTGYNELVIKTVK